jgi:hypothetical protein
VVRFTRSAFASLSVGFDLGIDRGGSGFGSVAVLLCSLQGYAESTAELL